jgi:hypothetical protein
MKCTIAWILLCAGVLTAGQAPGLKPRKDAAEYPVHETREGTSLGAVLLMPEQVRRLFVADLRNYAVVEVALYPRAGTSLEVNLRDFVLRSKEKSQVLVRAAQPATIAGVLQKKPPLDRALDVYPVVGVGYESVGTPGPARGTGHGGWTAAGVGIGMGNPGPRPASTDRDRETMRQELQDQMLPEGVAKGPVAGYLYFPLPDKKHVTACNLEYDFRGATLVLPLLTKH